MFANNPSFAYLCRTLSSKELTIRVFNYNESVCDIISIIENHQIFLNETVEVIATGTHVYSRNGRGAVVYICGKVFGDTSVTVRRWFPRFFFTIILNKFAMKRLNSLFSYDHPTPLGVTPIYIPVPKNNHYCGMECSMV